jgi:hypothetical protein
LNAVDERPPWTACVGLVALGLLTAAHLPMQEQRLPIWASVALACGVFLWVLLVARYPPPRETPEPLEAPGPPPRVLLLALAVALAVVAWRNTSGGTYRLSGVAAWIGAVASWLAAWFPRREARAAPAPPARLENPERLWVLATLAGILLIGSFFLFHRLSATPANPTSDHAEKLLDVLDLVNGQRPIFFTRNTGREPFQFYWTFALMKVLGLPLHYLTLKIGTAIIGLLALPALYLLGREMGGASLGLAVAALAAWSKWPVSLARQGLRYTLAVLPTAVVLWALLRYVRRGDRASVLWAGVVIGLGLHGYISFRVVPLLVPLVFAFVLADRRRRGRRQAVVGDGLLIAATAFLVALPLLHYTVERPDQFWYRAATRVAEVERPIGQVPLAIFAGNVRRMLLAFDWRGASTWVVIRPGEPFLDGVTASFWLVGIVLVVAQIARRSFRWAIVVLAFFVLTLPSTLSVAFPDENPSINRAGTAIPVVFLFAGLAMSAFAPPPRTRWTALVAAAGLAILLGVSVYQNYRDYFVSFHKSYEQTVDHSMEMAHVLGRYQLEGVPLRQMYLLYSDYWVDGRNIAFELGDASWASSQIVDTGKLPPDTGARPLVFLFAAGNPITEKLEKTYPRGKARTIVQSFPERTFRVYYVP